MRHYKSVPFWIPAYAGMTVYICLPSFPRKRESRGGLLRLRHYKPVPFWIPAYAGRTVTICLPSFPRKRESRGGLPGMRHYKSVPFWIPAYAGRTVESRRGKDGYYLRPPASPGLPFPFPQAAGVKGGDPSLLFPAGTLGTGGGGPGCFRLVGGPFRPFPPLHFLGHSHGGGNGGG